MEGRTQRPRLAIIGGGGAMGRLFGRLFVGAVSELYVFDFFDVASHSAQLGKLLDDLRFAVGPERLTGVPLAVQRGPGGTSWTAVGHASDPRRGRAYLRLTPGVPERSESTAVMSNASADSLVGLLQSLADGVADSPGESTVVYAGLPEDACALLARADVVLLAVGFETEPAYRELVRFYRSSFRSGSLIVDLGSTKLLSMAALEAELPADLGILGAHPLFGPTVSDLTGLIVAVVDASDGRSRSRWREWFLDQLVRLKMIVTPAGPREHDDAMAFVQALTHFALLSYAYTFVRIDYDPADLLAFRTPVFEPLLYLAARVAYLARSTPETYRSIQALSTRPDARQAFLDSAHELLDAIEREHAEPGTANPTESLAALFQKYGEPWSPDGRDRRGRQRREHLLEMGARLVDDLNQFRQDVVEAAGQVRAFEEKRHGQSSRILIGIVDLDLLAPNRQDVASQVRLRQVNRLLGSVRGGGTSDDASHDLVIPLARARMLGAEETLDWLLTQTDVVEIRSQPGRVPGWFDRDILLRLLKGFPDRTETRQSRIWDVALAPAIALDVLPPGEKAAVVSLSIVLHPADLVAMRRRIEATDAADFNKELSELEAGIEEIYRVERAEVGTDRLVLAREKDRRKRQRKTLIDQRTTQVDRRVRQETRVLVQSIFEQALGWLQERGCSFPIRIVQD